MSKIKQALTDSDGNVSDALRRSRMARELAQHHLYAMSVYDVLAAAENALAQMIEMDENIYQEYVKVFGHDH